MHERALDLAIGSSLVLNTLVSTRIYPDLCMLYDGIEKMIGQRPVEKLNSKGWPRNYVDQGARQVRNAEMRSLSKSSQGNAISRSKIQEQTSDQLRCDPGFDGRRDRAIYTGDDGAQYGA